MALPLFQVDAFANGPFSGNPAAVVLLDGERSALWMQAVAAEMNLSETAFLQQVEDSGYGLRWFTPQLEVDLCGHATLASAHVLWESGRLGKPTPAHFETKSGRLVATASERGIALDFPSLPPLACAPPDELLSALGAQSVWVGRSRFDYLVELPNEDAVRALRPDHVRLRGLDVRGVIVTAAASDGEFDYVSRFFAPGAGVDEDPVTGSAHCVLAPYWSAKLKAPELRGYQASARGGVVITEVRGERVTLTGTATTVFAGELLV